MKARIVIVLLLAAALPALAQSLSPSKVVTVRTAAELALPCTGTVWAKHATTGAEYQCVAGAWTVVPKVTVPGAAGVLLASDGAGAIAAASGVAISNRVITNTFKYEDFDTNGDGTTDQRVCGDFDGDGTLEITDRESCIEGAMRAGMTFIGLPGTYTGGFRTEITISQPVRWIEYGTLQITAPCSGTADALDDGDANTESYFLVRVAADDVTLENLTIHGGSSRWQFYQTVGGAATSECNWSTGHSTGGWTCGDPDSDGTSEWCPRDWHYPIHASGPYKNLRVINPHISYGDRAGIRLANSDLDGGGDCDTNEIGYRARIEGGEIAYTGEHALPLHWHQSSISGTRFSYCGSGSCVLLTSDYCPVKDITIEGFRCEQFGNKCIGTESTSGTNTGSGNWSIGPGVARSTGTAGAQCIGLNGGNTFNFSGVTITGVTCNLTGTTAKGISVQGGAANVHSNVSISGGSSTYVPGHTNTQKSAVFAEYVDDLSITGHAADVTGDASEGGDNPEAGIHLSYVDGYTVSGNPIIFRGQGVIGIKADASTNGIITGNAFDGRASTALSDAVAGVKFKYNNADSYATGNVCDQMTACVTASNGFANVWWDRNLVDGVLGSVDEFAQTEYDCLGKAVEASRIDGDNVPSITSTTSAAGVCRVYTAASAGSDSSLIAVATTNPFEANAQILDATNMREFAARVYSGNEASRIAVIGAVRGSAAYGSGTVDLDEEKTDGMYFFCAASQDNDGDGTTEANWFAVTMAGSDDDADGADLTNDGTGASPATNTSATKLDVSCADTNYHVFRITYDGTSVRYYYDGALKATHTTNIPAASNKIPGWTVTTEATAGTAVNQYVDWLRYRGIRP